MKSVTEFPSYLLTRGIEAKAALVAEGKTPEEIQTSLGATFKLEGDRLKHFFNSLDVAAQNAGLYRMRVVTPGEGESALPKAVAIEEFHYVPEFMVIAQPQPQGRDGRGGRGGFGKGGGGGGRGGRGGGGGGGMKGSPWGDPPAPKVPKAPKKP
jgi:hypothetical protein